MRVKNSLRNIVTAVLVSILSMLMGMMTQTALVKILGSEYLGLNSLFSNVLAMLNIAELGLSTSIIYYLYKPIANNDTEKIKSLMQFYKKGYIIIGLFILVVGTLIMPSLPFFIKSSNVVININIAYILALLAEALSYFLGYKRSILYANQKNYIIKIAHIIYLLIFNFSQVIFLFITKNFYIYFIIKIIVTIIENLVITIVANRLYSYLKEKDVKPLGKKEKKGIFKKIKAMFFHKIGSFIVFGTDNIIISKYLGLAVLGLYSNYHIIINSVTKVIIQIIQATTASVGNLVVVSGYKKQFDVFKKIRFANFWLSTFSAIAILIIMESFITIWLGHKYILPNIVLIVLAINFYIYTTRGTFFSFKDATGTFYEDRFIPILESVTNIVASIIFVKLWGLVGVFLGTLLSSFWVYFYSYPKYIYSKIFKRSQILYFKETLSYMFVFLMVAVVTYIVTKASVIDNAYMEFFKNCFIAISLPNLLMIIIFRRTDNFKYFWNLIMRKKAKESN